MTFLNNIPYSILLPASLILGLAPFRPEPHVLEKMRLLWAGHLYRPIDIFDLFMHLFPALLLLLKWLTQKREDRS